jgi:4-amino-4-deoxy-L-arabinose transferase-like glycosyltransferase
MGPYQTLDTQLEYNTTRGILRWGYPYLDRFGPPNIDSYGDLFNMPPLGFYTQALHQTLFGTQLETGIALITLLGLGCIILVYLIGKKFHGPTTGLIAAAFFALTPWQLIMTRAYLIDTQCLLLSLAYLYTGIIAIQKNSLKLTTFTGLLFAAALLTKQFAVFMLIPLAILYIHHHLKQHSQSPPKNKKLIFSQLTLFAFPVAITHFIWYNLIMHKELLYLFNHNDFRDYNFSTYTPTYAFVTDFLTSYGLGMFFCITLIISLFATLIFWRYLPKQTVLFDTICLITLGFILGLVLYLAVNLNLKAPYTSAIKYLYHALPLFSIAAASLVVKASLLFRRSTQNSKFRRGLFLVVVMSVGVLLAASLLANMVVAQQLSTTSYLIFRVQPHLDVGYSFYVLNPPSLGDPILLMQFVGFLVILSGFVWYSRHFITKQLQEIKFWFKSKQYGC